MTLGLIYAILASFIYGLYVVSVKYGLNIGLETISLTASTGLIAVIFSIIFLIYKKDSLKNIDKKHWFYLVVIGVLATGVATILGYIGQSLTSATNAGFLWKLSTVFTLPFAYFLVSERLSKKELVGALIMILGVFLLTTEGQLKLPMLGDAVLILATLVLGFTNAFAKKLMKGLDADIISYARLLFGSLFIIVVSFFIVGSTTFSALFDNFWIVFLIAILAIVYIIVFYRGILYYGASKTLLIFLTSAIFTVIGAVIFLGESISLFQITGGLVMLGGGYLINKR